MIESKELTNEEKLAAIKGWHEYGVDLGKTDIDFIIEQAGHAEKLWALANDRGTSMTFLSIENLKLHNEIKLYREALEFYADYDNHTLDEYDVSKVDKDNGKKARQALEVE